MKRSRSYLVCLLILAVFLPAAVLHARVFRSGGWLPGRSVFAAEEFGKCLYKALMRINGSQAEVSVVSCSEGMDAVRQRVMAGQGVSARFEAGESLGVGEMTAMGRRVRLMAFVPGVDPDAGLIVATEQALEDRGTGRARVLKHELTELPVISGSQVTGFMKNEDTHVAWETLTAPASAASAVSYYETNLRQAGWTPVVPVDLSNEGGMLCFVRGADVCCVRVARTDSDGETQVALLHKQGALK